MSLDEAVRLSEIAERPDISPETLYAIGSEAVWGAAFYGDDPAILTPAAIILQRAADELEPEAMSKHMAQGHLAFIDTYEEWAADYPTSKNSIRKTHLHLAGILEGLVDLNLRGDSLRRKQTSMTIYQMMLTRRNDSLHLAVPNPAYAHTSQRWHQRRTGNVYPPCYMSVTTRKNKLIPCIATTTKGVDHIQELENSNIHCEVIGSPLASDMERALPDLMEPVRGESISKRAEHALKMTATILLEEIGGQLDRHRLDFLDIRGQRYVIKIEKSASAMKDRRR